MPFDCQQDTKVRVDSLPIEGSSVMRIAIAGATGMAGTAVTVAAGAAGHDVVEISRTRGVDLLTGMGIEEKLYQVDAVIDVTNTASQDEAAATEFFTSVARNLGAAARRAGVSHTVVLSIIGADKTPDFGYNVAKVAHERATKQAAPDPLVLRAAQFHDFAAQMVEWTRDGDTVYPFDMQTQSVELEEVAAVLVAMAAGQESSDLSVAGPQPEHLVDQVRRLLDSRGDPSDVVPVPPPSPAMAAGSSLPDEHARLVGTTFDEWLASARR